MTNQQNTLALSALLARSWQEIRNRFVPFFLLAALAPAAGWLLTGLCFGFNPLTQSAARDAHPFGFLAVSLVLGLFALWMMASLVLLVCKRAQTPAEALGMGLGRFPRLFVGMLLYGLALLAITLLATALGLGLLFLLGSQNDAAWAAAVLIGLVWLVTLLAAGIYFILLPYQLILTDESYADSFRRAYALVKNRFWQTLGTAFLVSLIASVLSVILTLVLWLCAMIGGLAFSGFTYLFSFLGILPSALAALIYQVPMIALYIDRLSAMRQDEAETDHPSPESLPNN